MILGADDFLDAALTGALVLRSTSPPDRSSVPCGRAVGEHVKVGMGQAMGQGIGAGLQTRGSPNDYQVVGPH